MKPPLILFLIVVCLSSCYPPDRKYSPLEMYPEDFSGTPGILQRIVPASQGLLQTWGRLDNRTDYDSFVPKMEQLQEFQASWDSLHPRIRQEAEGSLAAVYFVKNLQGAGISDWVDRPGKGFQTVLILNPEILSDLATHWIAYRDRSAFSEESLVGTRNWVEASGNIAALQYVLAHEAAHLADYRYHYSQWLETSALGHTGARTYAEGPRFREGQWTAYRALSPGLWQDPLPSGFYGIGKKTLLGTSSQNYRKLNSSSSVSLYALQSSMETWAEDFAYWHITRILKSSWVYKAKTGSDAEAVYDPGTNPRVQVVLGQMDRYFKENPKIEPGR